jgi:hypothetical protein
MHTWTAALVLEPCLSRGAPLRHDSTAPPRHRHPSSSARTLPHRMDGGLISDYWPLGLRGMRVAQKKHCTALASLRACMDQRLQALAS